MTILTLVVGVIVVYNLTLRAFKIQGLTWSEEFSRYMLVVTTLMGCSIAVKHQGHMVMDTLVTALPMRAGHILRAFGYLICAVLYIYLGVYAYKWTGRLIAMNRKIESIDFPMWPVWVFVTYAILTMGWRYFIQTLKSIGDANRGEIIISEQEAQIAATLAEEEARKKAQEEKHGGPVE
ncbi:MAG: TRAP transporter small permease [Sphaerochaetaceae bacterium]